MAKLGQAEIRDLARKIIISTVGGIRYTPLVRKISTEHPETQVNNIHGALWRLEERFPNEISKPSRGLYTSAAEDKEVISAEAVVERLPTAGRLQESDFYEAFAEYLRDEIEELNHVQSLGGAVLKRKWGTPDVIGVYKPTAVDAIKFDLEIISGEVKTDPKESVVAFGQAISYRLFSHKTYIAMPTSMSKQELDRLESLCVLFGVGLVLFELDKSAPNFVIRVRAQRYSPDMFYLNQLANRIREVDAELHELLFG